ncbi:MAG: SpoIID/LytB domain-containing protein [Deltaproteobacteria bacterium]|nr:SpoIID/LytB domain-containing protein [Deltaproteobacteria bacterium]
MLLIGCATTQAPQRALFQEETTIRVALQKEPLKVSEIGLEEYLMGVLGGEIPREWPLEVLKAQAVAARTYTLYRKQNPRSEFYDLESTVEDQVFGPTGKKDKKIHQAVSETWGEVLKKGEEPFTAYYHSCCGGRLEEASTIWAKGEEPFVTDSYCTACPSYSWEEEISKSELVSLLADWGLEADRPWSLKISLTTQSGRAKELVLTTSSGTKKISTNDFRRRLGYQRIKSNWFEIEEKEEVYLFRGHGSGHGVGLCQWGAKGMAEQGLTYQEILKFYYPDTTIEKWHPLSVDPE